MTEIQYATATLTKAASDGRGRVEMLASMDIVDRQDEVMELAAWEADVRDFKAGVIPVLVDHDPNFQAGTVSELVLDRRGLFVAAQLDLTTDEGRDTYERLLQAKSEDMPGVSVGFETLEDEQINGRRHITKARLREVSILLTLAPAVPTARVLNVKDLESFEREFRAALAEFNGALVDEKHAAGRRYIQSIHDAAVKYGAKCVDSTESNASDEDKVDEPDDEEVEAKADDFIAETRKRIEALEKEYE